MDFAEAAELAELEDQKADKMAKWQSHSVAHEDRSIQAEQGSGSVTITDDSEDGLRCQRHQEPDIQSLSPERSLDSARTFKPAPVPMSGRLLQCLQPQ